MHSPGPPELECTVKSHAIRDSTPVAGGSVGPRLKQAKFGIPARDVAGCMTRGEDFHCLFGCEHDGTKLTGSCFLANTPQSPQPLQ
jgi:hypothetical protein